jgi:hypothetical protein
VNQFGAELIFKGGDLFADGRLTDSTFFRDSGEAAFFRYSDEHLHCIEFVHDSFSLDGFYLHSNLEWLVFLKVPIFLQEWHIRYEPDRFEEGHSQLNLLK